MKLFKKLLEHYSPRKDLTEIDPQFKGTGVDSTRSTSATPISYFYLAGTSPESVVRDRAAHKYSVKLPEHAKIYDIGTDPEGHVSHLYEQSKNRQVNAGIVDPDEIHGHLKSKGYHGFTHSAHETLPNVVGLYHKQPVEMAKSESNHRVPNFVIPRQGQYGDQHDLIDINFLKQIQGNPIGRNPDKSIDALKTSIQNEGLKELPVMSFDPETKTLKLGEGNHRVEALRQLGYTHVPVISHRGGYDGVHFPELNFKGLDPNNPKSSYVPADLPARHWMPQSMKDKYLKQDHGMAKTELAKNNSKEWSGVAPHAEVLNHVSRTNPHEPKSARDAMWHARPDENHVWHKTTLPISDFDFNLKRSPAHSKRDVQKYKKMIQSGSPIPPVVISGSHIEGKLHPVSIVDGRHRITAAKEAGLTHVPVYYGMLPDQHEEFFNKPQMGKSKLNKARPKNIAIKDLIRDTFGDAGAHQTFAFNKNPKISSKPVSVAHNKKTGKMHLVDGYHRVLSAEKQGNTHIKAHIHPDAGKMEYTKEGYGTYKQKPIKKSESSSKFDTILGETRQRMARLKHHQSQPPQTALYPTRGKDNGHRVLISPDFNQEGKWRKTYFWPNNEPVGHAEGLEYHEAVKHAYDSGADLENPIQDFDKSEKSPVKMSRKDFVQEHTKLIRELKHPKKKELRAEAKDQSKELKEVLNKGLAKALLEKGSFQRRNKFNPLQHVQDPKNLDNIDRIFAWQGYGDKPQKHREAIAPMEGAARARALHKLSAATKSRRAKDGGKEFLLHRGYKGTRLLPSMPEGATHETHVSHNDRSSWTPHHDVAHRFGYNTQTQKPNVDSAWIHENNIVSSLNQFGNPSAYIGDDALKNRYKEGNNPLDNEHEIIVDPHVSERASFTPSDLTDVNPDINARITQRGKKGYAHFQSPEAVLVQRRLARFSKSLHKALPPEQLTQQGYKFKILPPTKNDRGHVVRAYHNRKPIGHLVFSTNPVNAPAGHENEPQNGYHHVYNSEINPDHRGKGIYQHMITVGANHAKSLGSKGLVSRGYQRSPDATHAWDKIASHAISQNEKFHTKSPSFKADYFSKSLADAMFESLQKGEQHGLCSYFVFEGMETPELADLAHITHKYYGKQFQDEDKVIKILETYFEEHPFKEFTPKFSKVEMFGENEDIRVLRPEDEKPFLKDLKDQLDKIHPDKFPVYKPHTTVTPNVDKVELPVVNYILVKGNKVLWKAK